MKKSANGDFCVFGLNVYLNDFNASLVLQNDDNWPSWKWLHMQCYISVIKAMRTLRIKWAKRKFMNISGQWWPRWTGFKLYVRYFKHATTICCLSSLNWPAMRSRGLDIGQVLCCTSIDQDYIQGREGGGGVYCISSNRDDQMGAKITIQRKIPGPKINPQNIPCAIS